MQRTHVNLTEMLVSFISLYSTVLMLGITDTILNIVKLSHLFSHQQNHILLIANNFLQSVA